MLMIKFDKSGKMGLSSLVNWSTQFCQFQNKIKEEAKLEDSRVFEV
jgi:hypothetical protein